LWDSAIRGLKFTRGVRLRILAFPSVLVPSRFARLEEVAEVLPDPFLFQLYLFKDQAVNRELIQRAERARCAALVLTLDTAVHARRNRDCDNGLVIPLRVRPQHILEM